MARWLVDAMNISSVFTYQIVLDASMSEASSIVFSSLRNIAYAPSGNGDKGSHHVCEGFSICPAVILVPCKVKDGLGLIIPRIIPSRLAICRGLAEMLSGVSRLDSKLKSVNVILVFFEFRKPSKTILDKRLPPLLIVTIESQ